MHGGNIVFSPRCYKGWDSRSSRQPVYFFSRRFFASLSLSLLPPSPNVFSLVTRHSSLVTRHSSLITHHSTAGTKLRTGQAAFVVRGLGKLSCIKYGTSITYLKPFTLPLKPKAIVLKTICPLPSSLFTSREVRSVTKVSCEVEGREGRKEGRKEERVKISENRNRKVKFFCIQYVHASAYWYSRRSCRLERECNFSKPVDNKTGHLR